MQKAAFYLSAIVLAAALGAGCSTTNPDKRSQPIAKSDAILRVGVTPTAPPMIFKENGEYRGIEADLAREFAATLGKEVRFIEVAWEKQISELLADRLDIIMSGMTITPTRRFRMSFTDPYIRSGLMALVRRNDLDRARIFLRESKGRVGVEQGTTGDYYVQQYLRKARRIRYQRTDTAAKAVASGNLDLFIHDAPTVWWYASLHEADGLTVLNSYLTNENLGWGVHPDDAALLSAANEFIESAKRSGELSAVVRRWVPFWK